MVTPELTDEWVAEVLKLSKSDPAQAQVHTLLVIATCLVQLVEQNRGLGVFRECLLNVLKGKE